jgi:hypothetical protein
MSRKEAAIQKLQLDLNDATKIVASKEVELRDQMEKIVLLSEESAACTTLRNENAELLSQVDAMNGQLRNSAKELDLFRNLLKEAELCKGSMENKIGVLQGLHHQAEASLNAAANDTKATVLIYEEKLQHQANSNAMLREKISSLEMKLREESIALKNDASLAANETAALKLEKETIAAESNELLTRE